jgi:hypothetical protein
MPRVPSLTQLERVIRHAWCAETSDHPKQWRADNPARGQCGTSAYVIRELLGGEIVLARIGGTDPQEHHAWNRLTSGLELDVTRDQFIEPPELTECDIPEDKVLALIEAPATLLLSRVRAGLATLIESVE